MGRRANVDEKGADQAVCHWLFLSKVVGQLGRWHRLAAAAKRLGAHSVGCAFCVYVRGKRVAIAEFEFAGEKDERHGSSVQASSTWPVSPMQVQAMQRQLLGPSGAGAGGVAIAQGYQVFRTLQPLAGSSSCSQGQSTVVGSTV